MCAPSAAPPTDPHTADDRADLLAAATILRAPTSILDEAAAKN